MSATGAVNKLRSRFNFRLADYDVDAALNLVDLGQPQGAGNKCLPLWTGFRHFLAGLFRSVGTGTVSAFQIIAATAADGTGATVVVEHALGSAPDSVGDQVFVECSADQIAEVLPGATHVGVRVQLASATDEAVVLFVQAESTFQYEGLTADFIG